MKNNDNVHHWDIDSIEYSEIYRDLRSWANTPGFRIMKREILNHFKTFEKIRFVELGAGIGKMSILRRELKSIASKVGLKNIKIFCGGRFLRDFNYFLVSNVSGAIRKYLLRKKDERPLLHIEDNPREKLGEIMSHNETAQGFLGKYFSYSLFLIAYKSNNY